jgi:uncharacterized Zn finger protein (UPF0148 family)
MAEAWQCPDCGTIHLEKRCSRKKALEHAPRTDPEKARLQREIAAVNREIAEVKAEIQVKKDLEEIRETMAGIRALDSDEPELYVTIDRMGRVTGERRIHVPEEPQRRVRLDPWGRVVGDERT